MNPAMNAGEAEEGRRQREVAQRVFASEFNASTHAIKEDGTYGPSYVVSPIGAKINRLFAVGVLTSVEAVGATGDRFRAQVVDPTGTFNVYAGQYEPEATASLNEIRPPAVVALVGKSRTYSPEDGVTYVSVRPETIRMVEKSDRDAWVLESARHTMLRLDAMHEAQKMETPSVKALEDLGYTRDVSEGVIAAIGHYGKADLARFSTIVRDALESLLPGGAEKMQATPEFASAASGYAPAPAVKPATPATAPAAAAAAVVDNEHEELILALAEKMDDGKGAPWEDIVAEAAKKGVKEDQVEECLNNLMDKGQVYEPVLGRIKRT